MQDEVIVAGFGGQGVLLIGTLLAEAAMREGKEVTWVPSYGPEMRGGTCNCTVIISDRLIGSPVASEARYVIGMSEPSVRKFAPIVRPSGTILYDSSSGDIQLERDDVHILAIPAEKTAAGLGSPKVTNMVMLGALVGISDLVSKETLAAVMEAQLAGAKAKFIPLNVKAIEAGIALVKQCQDLAK